MSKTSVIPQTRTGLSRASSILLSPSKKRRVDEAKPGREGVEGETKTCDGSESRKEASSAEHFKWTFTRAAVAPCFIQDIFDMRESGLRDMEFFWLGRIPCRTVRFIGLLVGVQVWEKRTVYTVDDGTAVIDCAHAHPLVKLASPTKSAPAVKQSNVSTFANYLPSARTHTVSKRAQNEPPPPPKPVGCVGQVLQVVGRVVSRYDTRILLVDEISPCASFDDESTHIISVSELHTTTYHPTTSLPPFVPPPLPTSDNAVDAERRPIPLPKSPSKSTKVSDPSTPSLVRMGAISTTTSPSTSATASSPASSVREEQVPRLRHPSRLHTRDLNANTFRIYVKHYMDNAPPPSRRSLAPMRARSISPSPMPRPSQARSLKTPTKGYRQSIADATPRPTSRSTDKTLHTSNIDSEAESDDEMFDDHQVYGYTLSHLRRVPELSILARRVVKANARQLAKGEHKKSISSSKPPSSSSQVVDGAAVKRLFKQAIRTLFQEGDIVLWSGPVRPLPPPTLDAMLPSLSALWKANSSSASSVSTASSSRFGPSYEDWDDEALSDPDVAEEAYVPLTPAYFSRVLEDAIRRIMASSEQATPKPASKARGKPMSLIDRLRAQEEAGHPSGPTKEELLAWLHHSDERWERVGEWTVEEALQWGKREGRIWCIGKGRWELCG